MQNFLQPAKNTDLREVVYKQIKNAILAGVIKPGEKLSEVELAEQMAVSRTPVREAIRQLANSPLVTLTPRKGAYVARLSLIDATMLYELREDLEMFAAALVSRQPPVHELNEFQRVFSQSSEAMTFEDFLALDKRFHSFLYEASGNRFLMNSLKDIIDVIDLYRPYSVIDPEHIVTLTQEHREIIDALLKKNETKARQKMGAHIRATRDRLEESLRSRGFYE